MHVLEFLKNIIPIGKYKFYRGAIAQESIKQIVSVLQKYRKVLQGYGIENVRVVATTAVREARNKDIFVDSVFRTTGFKIEILTVGDIVSYLSYRLKNSYPFHARNVLVAELGSGNMDISLMRRELTLATFGLPVGTLGMNQLVS